MRFHLFFLLSIVAMTSYANSQILFEDNFDSEAFPDQAPLVAADGNASISFGANSPIGATNAAGDAADGGIYASTGSALNTRNGTRGYITTADANFTAGSGNVGQLHSHTAGGFMLVSVGPLVNNVPTPIPVTVAEGDIFRMTFDMYVQTPTTISTDLAVLWNTNLGTGVPSQDWTAYTSSMAGDNLAVTIEFTVDATTAGITEIAPQFQLSENSGRTPFNSLVAQIDNFVFQQITSTTPTLLGDVDLSGEVNFLDIGPFIDVLSGGTFQAEADCDENEEVNFLDIGPFIDILSGS